MSLFKQDPAVALAKTEDKIGSIESNIEALRAKRAEKLLEVEDPGEIVRLDKHPQLATTWESLERLRHRHRRRPCPQARPLIGKQVFWPIRQKWMRCFETKPKLSLSGVK
jgi:hypothetical protein